MVDKAEFEMLVAEAKLTGGIPQEFDAVEYLRAKIVETVERTNSYDPEIADAARKEVIQWLLILDLVETPPASVDVEKLEKDAIAATKKAIKADLDAIEQRLSALETADKVDALEKRLAEIEKAPTAPTFDATEIEKRLAALEKPATE